MKTLRDALKAEDLTLTAELVLNAGMSTGEIATQAEQLGHCADAIQVPCHRSGQSHVSPIVVGAQLQQLGIDPVVHLDCRDRNRIALQSDLLAAQSLGINNVLLMKGWPLPADYTPATDAVFDLNALELIATAAAIRDRRVKEGEDEAHAHQFYIGTVAKVFAPPAEWRAKRIAEKVHTGAQFVQLQVCMDTELLRDYMAKLIAAKLTWQLAVMAGVAVLHSAEAARALREVIPDAVIPIDVEKRLAQARDAEHEGIAIAAELLRALVDVPGISAANVMTLGDPALVGEAIKASGLR
ncbi:MAG: methylenetetrahydrofolate reductase [Pseudomonadota bacterium]